MDLEVQVRSHHTHGTRPYLSFYWKRAINELLRASELSVLHGENCSLHVFGNMMTSVPFVLIRLHTEGHVASHPRITDVL